MKIKILNRNLTVANNYNSSKTYEIDEAPIFTEVYNETLDYILEKEKQGEIFVLRPETKLPIKKAEKNPEVLKLVYNMGRKTMEENLSKLKEYLEIK